MTFQSSMRRLQPLIMLAGVTVTFSAAAQERAPEPALKSRDAKSAEPAAPAVDLKIEGVKNGLQIRVLSKEEGLGPDGGRAASCNQDCVLKLPAGSYTLIASQIERQEVPGMDVGAPPRLTMGEPDVARHRLGTALGVGGIVAAAMGSYLAIGALVARDGTHSAFPSGLNEFFFAGVTGIGIGAGLIIGGFSLAAANRASPMALDRMPTAVQPRDLTGMGVSVTEAF